MTEPKFTPGPWHIDPDDRVGMEWNNEVCSADGGRICFMANPGPDRLEEYEANARLIAAAPALYEALESLVSATNPLTEPPADIHKRREKARAALRATA